MRILILAASVIMVLSCGDKDESPSRLIKGSWIYDGSDVSITINELDIVDYFIELFELTEEQASDFAEQSEQQYDFVIDSFIFYSDGTFETESEGDLSDGSWAISDNGMLLTLTVDGDPQVMEVKTLSKKKLILYFHQESEEDFDGDEVPDVIKIDVTLSFNK